MGIIVVMPCVFAMEHEDDPELAEAMKRSLLGQNQYLPSAPPMHGVQNSEIADRNLAIELTYSWNNSEGNGKERTGNDDSQNYAGSSRSRGTNRPVDSTNFNFAARHAALTEFKNKPCNNCFYRQNLPWYKKYFLPLISSAALFGAGSLFTYALMKWTR